MNYQEMEDKYQVYLYAKRGISLVRGKKAKVWDENGKEYIDCMANVGSSNIGHANPVITQALVEQSKKISNAYLVFYSDERAKLLKKLAEKAPKGLNRSFLCNSGTESVEAALKFARASTKKTDFIYCNKAFHGRTFGSLSAIGKDKYREPFEPLLQGFHRIPFNDAQALRETITDKTAGFILELIQGEGGINIADKEYVKEIREICNEKNVLLIVDEVQTGFGRTGKMFASEHYDLEPDIMCVAKSIAGGIPMGATIVNDKINVPIGSHGSTFGGNPLACACANATIKFIEDNELVEKSRVLGEFFLGELKKIESNLIREVRGLGLMIGIELKQKPVPYLKALLENGVLGLPSGVTTIRYLPPLVISKEELSKVVEITRKVLQEEITVKNTEADSE